MITYLKGTLEELNENSLVIEACGVGYEVFCSGAAFSPFAQQDAPIKVYIYEHIICE